MKANKRRTAATVVKYMAIFIFWAQGLMAFTETFGTAVYKDTLKTTANWDVLNGKAVLQRVTKFAQTVDVINWGGGITAIEYISGGNWLIGGIEGKLNTYDGNNFLDSTAELSAFANWNIWAIKHNQNSGVCFIGGDGPSLNRRDGAGAWVNVKNNLVGFSTAVRAIACNASGSSWFFGGRNGSLNSFSGGTTWTDLKASLNFAPYDVRAIGNNGSYWLIAGTNGKIARYNGVTFTDLTPALYAAWGNASYDVYTLDWNGSYWLIGGGAGKIAVYDGISFTEKNPGGTQMYSVWSIKWNGAYWLIGGSQGANQTVLYTAADANITPYTEQVNPSYFSIHPVWAIGCDGAAVVNLIGGENGSLMKRTGTFNVPVNTDLSRDAMDFGANAINFAESNSAYWLIGGVEGSLNRYDGDIFTDMKAYLGWTGENLLCAGWNSADNYWLIGGTGGKLAKYDGSSFYDRTASLGFSGRAVKTIKWNGTQWLIGGEVKSLATSADGDNFQLKDISAYFGAFDAVNSVEWASPWWYVGGSNGSLVMYDGSNTYSDLTGYFFACLAGSYHINTIKYDGSSKIRIGCNGAKMADYDGSSFVNKSAALINFGTSDIYDMDYSQPHAQWMIGGKSGKINIATGTGIEVYSDESANMINFNMAAINSVGFNGEYWVIGGDSAKLNRYGLAYVSPGWVYSSAIDQWFAGYDYVTLTADQTLNGQQISYWLSANDGATWVEAAQGALVTFSGIDAGNTLKWRALLRTFDGIKSPFIDTVLINYDRAVAPTYTVTRTVTKTVTQTITPTITQTRTPSFTKTYTGTFTLTPTFTVTLTFTPTLSSTRTFTPTFTATFSCTQTVTKTATETFTRTLTYTPTFTPSVTLSATLTGTFTFTPSVTGTFTVTLTKTFSSTPTQSQTWTLTSTATLTPTDTGTFTATPSITVTPTQTLTHTVTPTFTESQTFTHSPTETMTSTITMTFTQTPTITSTWTNTATFTLTQTNTHTSTDTITQTVTQTSTGTQTFTQTETFTVTQTRTMSSTLTSSATPTCTFTRTITPTLTLTFTITQTHTVTPTYTITLTHTASPTITQTHTITPTPTRVVVVPGHGVVIIYPNPADEVINIALLLAEAGTVRLRLYNEAGVLCALKDEYMPAGRQVITLKTKQLALGVYLCLAAVDYDSGSKMKFGLNKFIVVH